MVYITFYDFLNSKLKCTHFYQYYPIINLTFQVGLNPEQGQLDPPTSIHHYNHQINISWVVLPGEEMVWPAPRPATFHLPSVLMFMYRTSYSFRPELTLSLVQLLFFSDAVHGEEFNLLYSPLCSYFNNYMSTKQRFPKEPFQAVAARIIGEYL